MCSVQEEGETQPRRKEPVGVGRKCMKCDARAVTIARTKDPFCRDCFHAYVTHRFRATFGKSRLVRKGEKVLLAFSGGVSSRVMLALVEEGLRLQVYKKLRFVPSVIVIDEGVLVGQEWPERCGYQAEVLSIAAQAGFPTYFTQLEQIFGSYEAYKLEELLGRTLEQQTLEPGKSSSSPSSKTGRAEESVDITSLPPIPPSTTSLSSSNEREIPVDSGSEEHVPELAISMNLSEDASEEDSVDCGTPQVKDCTRVPPQPDASNSSCACKCTTESAIPWEDSDSGDSPRKKLLTLESASQTESTGLELDDITFSSQLKKETPASNSAATPVSEFKREKGDSEDTQSSNTPQEPLSSGSDQLESSSGVSKVREKDSSAHSGSNLAAEIAQRLAGFKRVRQLEQKLKDLFETTKSLTAKENLVLSLRHQLLVEIARKCGFTKVLVGDSATRLAVRLLGNIAQGRGASLPLDTGFADDRAKDVMFVRPMREFPAREMASYVGLYGLHLATVPTLASLAPNKASIERVTESFVNGLQAEFPSTVNTIFRTGDKLTVTNGGVCHCALCQAPCGPLPDKSVFTHLQLPEGSASASATAGVSSEEEMWDNLCYGCQLTVKDMKHSMSVLPPYVHSDAGKAARRAKMRAEIEDFLLDDAS